ncbi:MAG: hypothetical protein GQE15_39180 [Archangiaceae bacterium]|nr:hypothetical protein [Archangiaceae bacterium]
MTTTHDWSEPIFGLPAPRPTPWRVPALVVLGALVVGSGGMAMTTAQPEEPIVSRPARLLHTPAPMVKVEVPAPVVVGPAAPAKPMARKRQPAPDVLGERL